MSHDSKRNGATSLFAALKVATGKVVGTCMNKHRHAEWLKRHPRVRSHFTPTSASWLNMVERFFRDLTERCVRRGVFKSVGELEQTIFDSISYHNGDPDPFIWTPQATDILEKVMRGRAKLDHLPSA